MSVIGKQINDYIKQYNFTYSGIQKTLEYCFEIKKKNLQKDKETIEKARKSKILDRHLEVAIKDEIYDELLTKI